MDHSDRVSVDDFACRFDFQSGWINLTLTEGSKEEAEQLARAAVEHFNPLTLLVPKEPLVKELADRALRADEDGPILVAACYTDGGGFLAELVVSSYAEDGVARPTPAEVEPMLLQWSNVKVVGTPDVSHTDLAAGPAVRVQATLQAKRLFGIGSRLSESIRYAVFPPGTETIIEIATRWEVFERTEELTELTDELVATMRLVPLDADGNEIGAGS
ncbi:hypothetical protein AB0H67_38520 [Streptomyces phaeochromogenes]|uniref:hypothetical protein n=1 Tax=Streptomyces phaeochromogenes TaxID=1923 RepID=UPI0034102385